VQNPRESLKIRNTPKFLRVSKDKVRGTFSCCGGQVKGRTSEEKEEGKV